MEFPGYICEYNSCSKKSILKSQCCSKYYCSHDHCQWDSRGHENCSFIVTLEGQPIAAFDVNHPEDHCIFEDAILVLPSAANSCLDCGLVVQEKDRCIGCQWPLCVKGCQLFEAKANHSAMECQMLQDASKNGLMWDGDIWKHGAIWLIRMALFKCRQPDLFSWIIQQSRRLNPPEEFERIANILTSVFLVRELLDVLDLSMIYGLIRNHFRSLSQYQKNILVLHTKLLSIPHGCFPNLQFSIANDRSLKIWPMKPIEANEILSICYNSSVLLLPKKARQDRLKGQALRCNCVRCEDPSEFGTYFSSVNCELCQSRGDDGKIGKLCQRSVSDGYICSVCDRKFDPRKIEELERSYSEDMARSWNSLYYLKMKLKNDFRLGTKHSLIHDLHHLYFQSSWRLLELLLKESLVHLERMYQDFVPQAETVLKILKTFVPFEIERPSGPVRLMSCILLLNLTGDLKCGRVGLDEAEVELRSIFFWMKKNLLEFSMDFQIYTNSGAFFEELENLERYSRDKFVRTVRKLVKKRTPVKRLVGECWI